jgi:hypothetical protein
MTPNIKLGLREQEAIILLALLNRILEDSKKTNSGAILTHRILEKLYTRFNCFYHRAIYTKWKKEKSFRINAAELMVIYQQINSQETQDFVFLMNLQNTIKTIYQLED